MRDISRSQSQRELFLCRNVKFSRRCHCLCRFRVRNSFCIFYLHVLRVVICVTCKMIWQKNNKLIFVSGLHHLHRQQLIPKRRRPQNLRLYERFSSERKLRNCLHSRLYTKRVIGSCSITWCAAMSSVFVKELNGGEEFRAANIVELFLSLTLILFLQARFLSEHLRFSRLYFTLILISQGC